MDCGLHNTQAIEFLSRSVQDLSNYGQPTSISLLKEINTDFANLYKYVHHHITQIKAGYDDSMVINLPILKSYIMPNSTQFSDWTLIVASTIDGETYFDGFTPLSYTFREGDRQERTHIYGTRHVI